MVSAVWQYCTRLPNNMVRCNTCERVMSYHGTTNLRVHIGRHFGVTPKRHRETGRIIRVVHLPNTNTNSSTKNNTRAVASSSLNCERPSVSHEEIHNHSIRWDGYNRNVHVMFSRLLENKDFSDVTLACDGTFIQCHKVILSTFSDYFYELLRANNCSHPIIFMKDVKFRELRSLLTFIYCGQVEISSEELSTFLRIGNSLRVKGLMLEDDTNSFLNADLKIEPPGFFDQKQVSSGQKESNRKRKPTPVPVLGKQDDLTSTELTKEKLKKMNDETHKNNNSQKLLTSTELTKEKLKKMNDEIHKNNNSQKLEKEDGVQSEATVIIQPKKKKIAKSGKVRIRYFPSLHKPQGMGEDTDSEVTTIKTYPSDGGCFETDEPSTSGETKVIDVSSESLVKSIRAGSGSSPDIMDSVSEKHGNVANRQQ